MWAAEVEAEAARDKWVDTSQANLGRAEDKCLGTVVVLASVSVEVLSHFDDGFFCVLLPVQL